MKIFRNISNRRKLINKMISQRKGSNYISNKFKMNLSNEQTRISSPMECPLIISKKKEKVKNDSLKVLKQKSREFSTCSIDQETSPSKLIFPKFSR